MKFRYITCFLGFLMAFCLLNSTAFAQEDWVEDPLKKPEVWKELKKTPTNTKLWESYFGKSLSQLGPKQRIQLSEWKQELMIRKLADNEAIVGFVVDTEQSEEVFIDEAAFNEIEKRIKEALESGEISVSVADFAGMEAMILLEGNEVKELKANILQNFVILEDIYFDRFAEYNVEYKYYDDTHPDGKYDRLKWMDEHDQRLHDLKMKEVNQLKEKYHVGKN